MEAEDVIKTVSGALYCTKVCNSALVCISIPTAEDILRILNEHERQMGEWIALDNCSNSGIYCSICNTKIFEFTHRPKRKLSRYCPHCGSQMNQEKILHV